MKQRYDQIRVVASSAGMFVKDARGQNIQVFACNTALRAGKPPVMQLNLIAQPFDVAGTPVFNVQDPATGALKAVRRIEWHDGTVGEFPTPPAEQPVMQQPAAAQAADPPGAAPITPAAPAPLQQPDTPPVGQGPHG